MRVFKLKPLSICDTNSYIVCSDKNNAVLIDAPCEADYIMEQLDFYGVTLKKIFLTHGHFDHVGAVADLVEKTGCEVYIHVFDRRKLNDDSGTLVNLFRIRGHKKYDGEVHAFTEDDVLTLDELEFDVIHTPGHTSGSCCFICEDCLFCGDTMFAKSVGRTDMPDGDSTSMEKSLKKIAELGGNLKVYPGHMETTTLDEARIFNPYLRQFSEEKE